MSASRPGNPDRGWNDPPMFLYNTENQAQPSPTKRTNLTQRVGMPQNYPSLANKPTVSPGQPPPQLRTPAQKGPPAAGPPPTGPPPTGPLPGSIPPPGIASGPPPASVSSTHGCGDRPGDEDISSDVCATTLSKLRQVLQSCQDKLQKRISDDIVKKLSILENSWSNDKLSKPVQQRMAKLAQALTIQQYDEANELHLSLMIDYVAEVSQWMVGVKRLIFEAKKHVPSKETTDTNDNKDNSETKQCEEETTSSKSDSQTAVDTTVSDLGLLKLNSEASEPIGADVETKQETDEMSKAQSEGCIGDSNGST